MLFKQSYIFSNLTDLKRWKEDLERPEISTYTHKDIYIFIRFWIYIYLSVFIATNFCVCMYLLFILWIVGMLRKEKKTRTQHVKGTPLLQSRDLPCHKQTLLPNGKRKDREVIFDAQVLPHYYLLSTVRVDTEKKRKKKKVWKRVFSYLFIGFS